MRCDRKSLSIMLKNAQAITNSFSFCAFREMRFESLMVENDISVLSFSPNNARVKRFYTWMDNFYEVVTECLLLKRNDRYNWVWEGIYAKNSVFYFRVMNLVWTLSIIVFLWELFKIEQSGFIRRGWGVLI